MTTTTKTNLSIGCRLRIFVIDIRTLFVFGFLFFAATTSLATAEFLMTHNTDEADRQSRIINGEEVLEDRFPDFALMYGTSMCGAVLIGPRLALGAAHCANASTNLRIGARDGRKSGVQINIQEVMAHPGHDSYNYTNDIALFYLEYPTDIPYLPPDPRPIFEVDTPLTVIGFGDTKKEENITQLSHHLLEVELKYVDSELCDQKHGGLGEVTDDMMCAKGEVGDSCRGDSGGPLLVKGSDISEDRLVGLVSWGRGCNKKRFPGVYTRISYLYEWIVETSCDLFPQDAPPYMYCGSVTSITEAPTRVPIPFPDPSVTQFTKNDSSSSSLLNRIVPASVPSLAPVVTDFDSTNAPSAPTHTYVRAKNGHLDGVVR